MSLVFFNKGTIESKVFGISFSMLMMVIVTVIGLMIWKIPRNRVLLISMVLIVMWVCLQLALGQSFHTGFIIFSVLLFSLVIAGISSNSSLLWFQIGAAYVAPFLAVLAYYLGLWEHLGGGRQTFFGINTNQLAMLLAASFLLGVVLGLRRKGLMRWLILGSVVLFIPPILITGSREGTLLAAIVGLLFLVLRSRRKLLIIFARLSAKLFVSATILLLVMLFVFGTDPLGSIEVKGSSTFWYWKDEVKSLFITSIGTTSSSILFRWTDDLSYSIGMRIFLLDRGWDAFLEKPWTGHGMDAPISKNWLSQNIGWFEKGIATHNGYLDYLIMGGLPLCFVFLILQLQVNWRLCRATHAAGIYEKDLLALAFCLNLIFLCYIFTGSIYSKLAWWLFGFGLQILFFAEKQIPGAVSKISLWSKASAQQMAPVESAIIVKDPFIDED
jgi:O-antigen ligase